MKTIFRQILKAAKARVKQSALPQGRKNPAWNLSPAPAYWLLQPVHPREVIHTKYTGESVHGHDMYK